MTTTVASTTINSESPSKDTGVLVEALEDLLEAIPKQGEDMDWWPDELTRAVDKARKAISSPSQPEEKGQEEQEEWWRIVVNNICNRNISDNGEFYKAVNYFVSKYHITRKQ